MLAKDIALKRRPSVKLGTPGPAIEFNCGSQIGSLQFHSLLAEDGQQTERTVSEQIVNYIKYELCRDSSNIDVFGMFQATSMSIRNKLIDNWQKTYKKQVDNELRTINYLSLEFLMGRALTNSLYNLEIGKTYTSALRDLGFKLEDLQQEEMDAGLGNGGLGRLAACYVDSLACMNVPAFGYGLRYNYGMFRQEIKDGYQTEMPDYWLKHGTPLPLVERLDREYVVQFGGHTSMQREEGELKFRWEDSENVRAVAYDCLCPGQHTDNTACIRLWSARPFTEFQLNSHNNGDFYSAIREKSESENITFVLYPNDSTENGKKLRLKQEYFFVSASIQDMLRRAAEMKIDIADFDKYFAIQLNDTHPTLGIPELMHQLLDEYGYSWEDAWKITQATFFYTNHTVLPEALEKWSLRIMQELLPRHTEIILEINRRFLELAQNQNCTIDQIRSMSIIEESYEKQVRMANLAIIASSRVNGVAKLHSDIIKDIIFPDFNRLFPGKFTNITNGVTPRRWMAQANPLLTHFITKQLKTAGFCESERDWIGNMEVLKNLVNLEKNAKALQELLQIKQSNKARLAHYIERHVPNCGGSISEAMLFDTQVKRIHEYKRQQLNILQAIALYLRAKKMTEQQRKEFFGDGVCKIFAGKAASAYDTAKRLIKLINAVADVVNNDEETKQYLRVVFIPNYNVSSAEIIFPATDLSEQISTAGMEASGTGNMKACMNGGIIIGTLDGANVEIEEEVGEDNIFIFGALAEEVEFVRKEFAEGKELEICDEFKEAISAIKGGLFGNIEYFAPIVEKLENGNDYYLTAADFESYNELYCEEVLPAYKDKGAWALMMLNNIARMGYFSSDRSIKEYCDNIWHIQPFDEIKMGDFK